tara:strand:- start:10875 stop:11390 length:516 start_codon:yes stop_codon:yes gene_type:complete
MKAVLRGIVSMAFSTIEDQKTQRRVLPKPENIPVVSRPTISPPSPVPADDIYRPLSPSDPIPFGAVTEVEPVIDPFDASNMESALLPIPGEEVGTKDFKSEDLVPDDLAQIKGLNPIAIMGLNKRGIVTYLQIANLTDQEIDDIEKTLDLPGCFNRYSWRYQSRQLSLEMS